MKLLTNLKQLQHKKVLIMGLGTKDGGVGAAVFCHQHHCEITITDLQDKPALQSSIEKLKNFKISYHLGGHLVEDFIVADIVIRNPGIKRSHPLLKIAQSSGATIESPLGIFCALYKKPFVGITGTKGKSLTTHLVEHILLHSDIPAVAAGNNCRSPLRFMETTKKIILELSSWQLKEMGLHHRSPNLACWLNFFPDHQNYYADLDQYWEDKMQISKHQNNKDCLILPWSDQTFKHLNSNARTFYFDTNSKPNNFIEGVWINQSRIEINEQGRQFNLLNCKYLPPYLKTPHYLKLTLAAIACSYLAGVPPEKITRALTKFKGLPHRFETLYCSDNFSIINDSAATTPDSTLAAIKAVNQWPLILIAGGGGHKNLDYRKLSREIEKSVAVLILFNQDQTSPIIKNQQNYSHLKLIEVDDMEQAVGEGMSRLNKQKRGTLLLSPGCSGSPFFRDLFQRGELFKQNVTENIRLLQN
ncbi:MAG: hypothetical protein APR63_08745 [Desulfuromonas sp. SDB]|nr:MAG: hypothetical protein APR63_08745 [Desulfuromonas sp. SDB]